MRTKSGLMSFVARAFAAGTRPAQVAGLPNCGIPRVAPQPKELRTTAMTRTERAREFDRGGRLVATDDLYRSIYMFVWSCVVEATLASNSTDPHIVTVADSAEADQSTEQGY
jgi:hypothetical protein